MLQALICLSFCFPPYFASTPVEDFDQLWGDPTQFVTDWESDIQPLLTQWAGLGVAVAGVSLVIKALIK